MLAPWKESSNKPGQCIKKQRHHFGNKGLSSQSDGFSSSDVWIWEPNHKEGRVPKNWCFQTVVLEKTLKSHLDCKEIKPVNPKGNQPWIFIGRTDTEGEDPVVWPPNVKSQLTGKDIDAGKDWRQEEKGTTGDEMVGQHHWLNGMSLSKFWEMVKDREAWRAAVSPWGCKELDMTQQLNNNEDYWTVGFKWNLTKSYWVLGTKYWKLRIQSTSVSDAIPSLTGLNHHHSHAISDSILPQGRLLDLVSWPWCVPVSTVCPHHLTTHSYTRAMPSGRGPATQ